MDVTIRFPNPLITRRGLHFLFVRLRQRNSREIFLFIDMMGFYDGEKTGAVSSSSEKRRSYCSIYSLNFFIHY